VRARLLLSGLAACMILLMAARSASAAVEVPVAPKVQRPAVVFAAGALERSRAS
jgi:hypothetical protein